MNITIKKRLIICFCVVTLMFVVQVTISIFIQKTFQNYSGELKTVQKENFTLKSRLADHLIWVNNMQDAIFSGEKFTGELDDTKCKFGQWYYEFRNSKDFDALGPVRKGYINSMESFHKELHKSAQEINDAKNRNEAMEIYESKTKKNVAELEKIFNDFIERNIMRSDEKEAKEKNFIKNVNIINILVIILIVLIVGSMSTVTIRRIISSINKIVSGLSVIASGDLRVKIDPGNRDELGMLSNGLNSFTGKISDVVKDVQDASSQLASSSSELSAASVTFSEGTQSQAASTEEITATIEQMAAGVENVASAAQIQSESMESFTSLMEKLSTIINEMSKKISSSMDFSEDISKRARAGGNSLKQMSESMINISESSKQMTNVISIIQDISSRINLLSLNAAIEAARAGEAGRGFAVVSDEISNLADQTDKSINEITALIKSNESEIARGHTNVNEAVSLITGIIEKVSDINGMMNSINEQMQSQLETNQGVNAVSEKVKKRSEEIRSAASEQRTAMSEIVKSIGNINELTQTISSGSEEISSNSEEISGMAEILQGKVNYFRI